FVARRNRQPRNGLAEARIGTVIPLHGSALAVAALLLGPTDFADRVLYIFLAFGIVVLHPDLFAVVHDGGASQREIKSCHHLRDLIVVLAVAITVERAHNVVIAQSSSSAVAMSP